MPRMESAFEQQTSAPRCRTPQSATPTHIHSEPVGCKRLSSHSCPYRFAAFLCGSARAVRSVRGIVHRDVMDNWTERDRGGVEVHASVARMAKDQHFVRVRSELSQYLVFHSTVCIEPCALSEPERTTTNGVPAR